MKFISQTYFISDTHFSHSNILTFKRESGALLRPDFEDYTAMDERMIDRWNAIVRPDDKVYHLGDVTMHARYLPIVRRLNGRKRLILGNHDIFGYKEYAKYFGEVYAMRMLPKEGIMATHIPLHINCVKKGWINVHGHIHDKLISEDTRMLEATSDVVQHPKYFSVCVEQRDYTPVHIDIIRERVLALRDIHTE